MQTVVRFAAFEIDLRTRELRKRGLRIRLQDQPFRVLELLLKHPGEVVTREELQRQIWPADTFVDFDLGLNTAIKRLRQALGDSAENPRFVETLPRLGYRFVCEVGRGSQLPSSAVAVRAAPAIIPSNSPTSNPPPSTSDLLTSPTAIAYWLRTNARALSILLIAFLVVGGYIAARYRTIARGSDIHSIAVLPLENLSADPEQEYFADGMTDELITNLAKLGVLRVISRSSVMQFKRTRKPVPEIGRELNVDAIVEGTVTRSGDSLRITAQLIRTVSDQHLWADEFRGDVRDVLTLQNEVARAIAGQIRSKLRQQMQPANLRTVNSEAYEYYLKGRYSLVERSSKVGNDNAIRYFEMAIGRDPNYAPPYAGLAHCYALGSFQGTELSPREAWSKGADSAKKALELDDQLAEAHIAMANVRFRFDWNWPEAEQEFRRGLELNPNDVLGHDSYSIFLGIMGRFDEAVAESIQARELDPLSPHVSNTLSYIYSWSRRQDDAIKESRRTLQLDPNFTPAHSALAWSYEEKGMYAEAVSEELNVEALTGKSPQQIELLRNAFAVSGLRGFWEKRLEWEKRQLNHPRYFVIARLCIRLGRTDEAFDWLEKAYGARYPNMPNIKFAAMWLDPVRSDPRYVDLLRRIGLPR